MVETRDAPEVDRALEFPASFEATTRRMLQYGQCCAETAEELWKLSQEEHLDEKRRELFDTLRKRQAVLGKLFVAAAREATEAMKAREAAMLELPLSDEAPPAFR